MYPHTVAQLKENVFAKFPRQSPTIKGIFDNQVESWIHELCKAFPFYFMRTFPLNLSTDSAFDFPLTLATEVRKKNKWMAPGWLIAESGVGQYQFSHPVEIEQWSDPTWWVNSFVEKIHFIKEFDVYGAFLQDIPVYSRDIALSHQYNQNGRSRTAYLSQTENGAYLNLNPVPDDYYLYAVEFQVVNPPIYNAGGVDTFNQFLNYAPRIVELYCLIQVADYFDEPNLSLKYERSLFGTPPKGLKTAITEKTGLIGDLVADSQKAIAQANSTLRFFQSSKEAVGRSGPGRGWTRPNRYGYWSNYPY